ncbi:MAG: YdeI/OmpD-associated family protein [Bacteroidota bacterium]
MAKKKTSSAVFEFGSTLERSDNKLWGCHFPVPTKIAESLITSEDKRVICTLNGTQTMQCAILFYKKGRPVISVNKKIRDTLGLDFGMDVTVSLRKDASEYGLPMPEELSEVFRQDPPGKKFFHALTPGKQRTLLYIIGNVKDQEKRIQRSLIIVDHLKEFKGVLNYRKLNIALKNGALMPVNKRNRK